VVTLPWIARNVALTGHPVALAAQNLALKAGDSTAEPATQRALLSAVLPATDLNKLGNKTLTYLQENLKSRLWSGGGLWLTAFFVAGWLYSFRSAAANRLRWTFTAALAVLLVSQGIFNSGESERLVACWLAPLVMVFGAGFFFVLLGSNSVLGPWPRACAAALVVAQALPLAHDALEPRRLHFSYPPYFPGLFIGMRQELERRDPAGRFGVMAQTRRRGCGIYTRCRSSSPSANCCSRRAPWTGRFSANSRPGRPPRRKRRLPPARMTGGGSTAGCSRARCRWNFPSARPSGWRTTSASC
jgi:hypothetical protein